MNQIIKAVCAACFGGVLATAATAQERVVERATVEASIGERQVGFLAVEVRSGRRCRLAGSDLDTRHAPWSTFKIPNLVIAIETGAAAGLNHWRDWDEQRRPAQRYWPADWRRGQTLETAFRRSAAWYFQDVALAVGSARYRDLLAAWGYGNAAVPDGSDSFWLGGPLAISISEQTAFLARLVSDSLGLAPGRLDAIAGASADRSAEGATLHGKTGSGPVVPGDFAGEFEGWYVGWVARPDATPVVFAHHARGPSYAAIRDFRRAFAVEMLKTCRYLPAAFPG